ncbi:ATP-binding cassette domain-containing protein [Klebsiella pneumoniae]
MLKGIDLQVENGEVISIIGPSGSGKTTLIRTINALESLDGGEIILYGEDYLKGGAIVDKRQMRAGVRRIGMVFQSFNLFPHRTVLDNVMLGNNIAMILQSHGLLSVGRTVADAFYIMYYLNRACEIQMAAAQLAALSPIHTIAPHLSQHACEQLMGVEHERQQVWQAWLRRLDRLDTSYKD